jgi:cell shape-determining protein MreC
MAQSGTDTNVEFLLHKLQEKIKANNRLLKENNELQKQVLEYLKKKKRCKSCKKE